MKKLLFLALVAILATSCANQYKINGFIDGLSGKVYLALVDGKKAVIKDSTTATNGKFSFSGEVELPILAQIQDSLKIPLTNFFLENSNIKINGMMFELDSIKVTGSKEHDQYIQAIQSINAAPIFEAYVDTMKTYIVNNPKSVSAAYLLYFHLSPTLDYKEIRSIVAGFDTLVKKSPYIILANEKANILERTSAGHKFVDFTATDTMGNNVALSSVAGKGKWVLLDFWASWCGPCRDEIPVLITAYNTYKDKNFDIISLSVDANNHEWKNAIRDYKMTWTNVNDIKNNESLATDVYSITSIPSNVLISPDGVIYARNVKGDNLLIMLNELLK